MRPEVSDGPSPGGGRHYFLLRYPSASHCRAWPRPTAFSAWHPRPQASSDALHPRHRGHRICLSIFNRTADSMFVANILELLQPSHLSRQQAAYLRSSEVGCLADPNLAADISNRHAIGCLLQNERPFWASQNLEAFIVLRSPSLGIRAENSSQRRSRFRGSDRLCAVNVNPSRNVSSTPSYEITPSPVYSRHEVVSL
jgi:hypothetical protein